MPSTIVHMAFAGMIAAGLLGAAFDRRALLVVLAATAFPDLDSFTGFVTSFGHRTALHTLVVPLAAAGLLLADTRLRGRSIVRSRWGAWGVRVAWVSILCYAAAGVGLDLFGLGANALWPLHDQLYTIEGRFELSTQRGIVQTFVDVSSEGSVPTPQELGSSEEVHVSTGVDPNPGAEPENVDRVFPIVRSGPQLLILLVGTLVTAARFYVPYDLGDADER